MTREEKDAIIGKKKVITGNSSPPYTVKEIWEHKGLTLCSFEESKIVVNIDIVKDPPAELPPQK